MVRSGKLKRKPFNSNGAGHLLTIAIFAFSYPLVLSDSSNICIIFCVADVDALYDRSQRDTSQLPCPTMPNGVSASSTQLTPTATNSVLFGLCSRFPSNSSSKRPAIPRGAGRAYGAPIIR